MAKIFPFCGVIYNKKKIKNLSKVISPPYDVISKEEQENLYSSSDFNMVRLVLGKEFIGDDEYNNKHVRAAASFEGWLRHGVLVRDQKPAIYLYEQKFKFNGKSYSRIGFIALIRLQDGDKGKVFPHEYTLSKPKFDRIELLKNTSANFDCIFSIFSDEKQKISKLLKKIFRSRPQLEIKGLDGVVNKLWRVTQKSTIKYFQKELKDKSVFIADGHHRYEAAQQFKNEMKVRNTRFTEEESYNHVMMCFVPVENNGLVVLPIHRIVKRLPPVEAQNILEQLGDYFNITPILFNKKTELRARKKIMSEIAKHAEKHAFGVYFKDIPNQYYLLVLKDEKIMDEIISNDKPSRWKHLDVSILHNLVFKKVLDNNEEDNFIFTKNRDECLDRVKNEDFAMGVLLNPTKIDDIIAIAEKLERMPQKSTYFYPKLTTGMVLNKIILGERIE